MNVKLAFTPASQNPVDLLAVVLDDERTLHEIDDPALAEHVRRAGEPPSGTRRLKREYFATLPEGARAKAVVVYWSPQLKSVEPLGEREDLHRARAAPRPRLPPAPRRARAQHEGRRAARGQGGRGRRPRHATSSTATARRRTTSSRRRPRSRSSPTRTTRPTPRRARRATRGSPRTSTAPAT